MDFLASAEFPKKPKFIGIFSHNDCSTWIARKCDHNLEPFAIKYEKGTGPFIGSRFELSLSNLSFPIII